MAHGNTALPPIPCPIQCHRLLLSDYCIKTIEPRGLKMHLYSTVEERSTGLSNQDEMSIPSLRRGAWHPSLYGRSSLQ